MNQPIALAELEIVAYATALADHMLPRVVPPVFRARNEPQRYYVPPFTLLDAWVCGATEIVEAEYRSFCDQKRITPFAAAFAAKPNHELWLDHERVRHYEPQAIATERLRDIANAAIAEALAALQNGQAPLAERKCGIALAADDRIVEPFAIKAAIRRVQHDRTGEDLMRTLTAELMSATAFESLVATYAGMYAVARPAGAPAAAGRNCMAGVASRPAQLFPHAA